MSKKSIIKAGYEEYLNTRRLDHLRELSNGLYDADDETLSLVEWGTQVRETAARNLLRRIVDAQRIPNQDATAFFVATVRDSAGIVAGPYMAVYNLFTMELVNVLVDHLVELLD